MSGAARLPVVLLWHMHQPQYRDPDSGEYILPWTYLHAIKDYADMAAHLEANPRARAVVNFAPILIEQLEELAARVGAHLASCEPLPDPVLAVLSEAPLPLEGAARLALLQACLRAQRAQLIDRYPPYAELADLAVAFDTPERMAYASDQYLHDIGVWYHIAWLGETVKRSDARVAALIERARDFGPAHRRTLLELIGDLLAGLLGRYRALADRGQVELAMSPYAHPILPLLIDFQAAHESVPTAPLPRAAHYPGGEQRAAWHMEEGLRVFRRAFGRAPAGCWPSEGAISARALQLVEAHGMRWAASSGNVLRGCLRGGADSANSANDANGGDPGGEPAAPELRAWQVPGSTLSLCFRHDELSDLIGFTYQSWHGDDAVRNFIAALERVAAEQAGQPGAMVLIALDGENAWEHYPFNGYYFLQGLYAALANHPQLELTTLGDALARDPSRQALPRVVAGSWVHGTLATWIGDADKNAGWDLLVQAKLAADEVLADERLSAPRRTAIERQLALCESSDWFWWFGDYNPYEAVRDFDRLFRHQLASLYRLLGRAAPESLSRAISVGRGAPEGGGVMRRAQG
ncbi:MAG: glycoside hydrolase [Proteobacteria bacterium]|nr:glycoside hydrolase [Pseudomonadota bacterium]